MTDAPRTLDPRPDRTRRLQAAKRRARIEIATVVAIVVLALVLGLRVAQPSASRAADSETASGVVPGRTAAVVSSANRPGVSTEPARPTPFFASYRSLQLYLPIPVGELTEIAFHQASGNKSYSMASLLPDADMSAAHGKHGTGRTVATDTVGPAVLSGAVLRMWRSNRSGPADTAVDIGAEPGTLVFAPVTGEVTQVKPYLLYNEFDDYEIHIQPTGWPDIDVVLIHVDKPLVAPGDHVVGGCTQLAEVRRLSNLVTPQIAAYTVDAGDHVHMQLNKIPAPGEITAVGGS